LCIGGDIFGHRYIISSNKSRKWYWATSILFYWESCIEGHVTLFLVPYYPLPLYSLSCYCFSPSAAT
jgi:hypothetical protein